MTFDRRLLPVNDIVLSLQQANFREMRRIRRINNGRVFENFRQKQQRPNLQCACN